MTNITKDQQIVVYGLGSSGVSCLQYLIKNNHVNILACDDNQKNLERVKSEFLGLYPGCKNIFVNDITDELVEQGAIIVAAPGIALNYPVENKIVAISAQKSAKLMCDIELFYHLHQAQMASENVINVAITGTNGKSTICAMLNYAFAEDEISSAIVGNFGIPIFDFADDFSLLFEQNKRIIVINEVSSFQLDLINNRIFDIFVISNITEDHLTRYENFKAYIDSKLRAFDVVNDISNVVINNDDLVISQNLEYQKYYGFSKNKKSNSLLYCDNENLIFEYLNDSDISINSLGLNLDGDHNFENFLAVAASLSIVKNKFSLADQRFVKLVNQAKSFSGLDHRMQKIASKSDILFINDSKATNPESALRALQSYKNIFWIVGGDSKGCQFDILKEAVVNVEFAYVIGEDFESVEKFLKKNDVNYEICFNLDNAIDKSYANALNFSPGEAVIMLSPACSSLDQWQNYIKRGEYFCKKVNEL